MKKVFTIPKINKANNEKWYVYYSYQVPKELKKYTELYKRGTHRFRVYHGINRLRGEERERAANELRDSLELALKLNLLNPFTNELAAVREAGTIKENYAKRKVLTEGETRQSQPLVKVLAEFIRSREARKVHPKTITSYRNTVAWLNKTLAHITVADLKYIHVSQAINKAAAERSRTWGATTINKEWEFAYTIFNWMEAEDYVIKNPLTNKITKLKTNVTIHRWYDRATAAKVKAELIKTPWLYRVCQFTYWILIRSKAELQSIQVRDIDFDLHQIRFRKEWAKNGSDQNRDYGPEFAQVLAEMNLKCLPDDWYIFGKDGKPGPLKCGHNYFSKTWEKIRTRLGLSSDFTIYGWKHTRIVHMMMLNKTAYEIAHAARHGNTKTTEDYKRDYDISLTKIYGPEDLTF